SAFYAPNAYYHRPTSTSPPAIPNIDTATRRLSESSTSSYRLTLVNRQYLPPPTPSLSSPAAPLSPYTGTNNPPADDSTASDDTTVQPSHTNLYIRGLSSTATDAFLATLCESYGAIVSHKAIVDLSTGECKGYGFVMYETAQQASAAMEGLVQAGYQVSYARTDPRQPSVMDGFNSRLLGLGDEESTNVYVSNLPAGMGEEGMRQLFLPHKVVSNKILRDPNQQSRGVGFARMETREAASKAIEALNGLVLPQTQQKLQVRFADSMAQKRFKIHHQQVRRRLFSGGADNAVVSPGGGQGQPQSAGSVSSSVGSPHARDGEFDGEFGVYEAGFTSPMMFPMSPSYDTPPPPHAVPIPVPVGGVPNGYYHPVHPPIYVMPPPMPVQQQQQQQVQQRAESEESVLTNVEVEEVEGQLRGLEVK
ncbi:hypothetical protein HK101_004441, partial [Irineochytrium annulatum]